MKLKVGMRILLGYGALLIFAGTISITAYYSFGRIEATKEQILQTCYPGVIAAKNILVNNHSGTLAVREYLASGDKTFLTAYQYSKIQARDNLEKALALSTTGEEQEKLENIKILFNTYEEVWDAKVKRRDSGTRPVSASNTGESKQLEEINRAVNSLIQYQETQMYESDKKIRSDIALAKTVTVVLCIASLLAALVIALIITRSITRPLGQIDKAAGKITAGDLRETVVTLDKGEFGDLAKTFNEMIVHLQNLIGQITNASQQLVNASEGLSASSAESEAASRQMADTTAAMAAGTAEYSQLARQSCVLIEQVSMGIGQVAQSAEATNLSACRAHQVTLTGQDNVLRITHKMEEVRTSVESVAKVIAELQARSRHIGQIIVAIEDIAEQTNLLSLNAAIEAARAGEQGKGFAVVAEEVRKLAGQSRLSAQSIAELIGNIQAETAGAVAAMNNGLQDVDEGVQMVYEARDAFALISGEVAAVARQVEQVSAAGQQMAAGSEQVVTAIKDMERISQHADALTQAIMTAVTAQATVTGSVAAQADKLTNLAVELRHRVARFQV